MQTPAKIKTRLRGLKARRVHFAKEDQIDQRADSVKNDTSMEMTSQKMMRSAMQTSSSLSFAEIEDIWLDFNVYLNLKQTSSDYMNEWLFNTLFHLLKYLNLSVSVSMTLFMTKTFEALTFISVALPFWSLMLLKSFCELGSA